MRINIITSLMLVLSLFASSKAVAQENTDVGELANNVSQYYVEQYKVKDVSYGRPTRVLDKTLPSLRFDNSLQVGTALPGVMLTLITELYVDVDKSSPQADNFSQRLHNASHYWSAERTWPCISLDYQHSVKEWLSLGVKTTVGWKSRTQRHVITNDAYQRRAKGFVSLLFNMRFSWLHRRCVSMYSSFGVGLFGHFQFNNNWVVPMYDAAWVGISVGKQVYGFAEFGGGAAGVLRGGLGVRF